MEVSGRGKYLLMLVTEFLDAIFLVFAGYNSNLATKDLIIFLSSDSCYTNGVIFPLLQSFAIPFPFIRVSYQNLACRIRVMQCKLCPFAIVNASILDMLVPHLVWDQNLTHDLWTVVII